MVAAELDGELVLLDTRTGVYYGLNRVGADIWRLLAQGYPTEAIARHLLENYEVDAGTVERDLTGFIAGLLTCGLAQRVG